MPGYLVLILSFLLVNTSFAMRCMDSKGIGRIVQQGDNMAVVMIKCDKPDYSYTPGLLLDQEVWVYQRDDGMIYTITFLQGQVENIEANRL